MLNILKNLKGLAGFAAAMALVAFVFAKSSGFGLNYILGWQGIGVDAMTHFHDLTLTQKGAQYFLDGQNPYIDGAFNDKGIKANYPPFLLMLTYGFCGLCGGADNAGYVLAGLVIACFIWLSYRLSFWGGLCLGLGFGFGSGALALERGNTDLLVFLLVVGMCLAIAHRKAYSSFLHSGLFIASTALKIFPLFSFPLFFLYWPKQRYRMLGFALAICAIYAATQYYYLPFFFSNTEFLATNSYGMSLWAEYLPVPHRLGFLLPYFLLLLIARLANTYMPFSNPFAATDKDRLTYVLCLAGGSIFLGTYMLGSFNYRLVFALLCVPFMSQLTGWQRWLLVPSLALFAAWPAIENNIFWYIPWTYANQQTVGLARQALGFGVAAWCLTWLVAQIKGLLAFTEK
jgi:hypothetical protein